MMQADQVMPGVYHIRDALGVYMTLLAGTRGALLVDTGYGLEDVQAFVRTITGLPLMVILTHGHHDHCMGARWFEQVSMFPEDAEDFCELTGEASRRRILENAAHVGFSADEGAYLQGTIPMPRPLQEQTLDLGGLTAQVIHCPGHTPGSCVVWVPERKLLLSGDDWNPCTWLFFPRALGLKDYRSHVQSLRALPFAHVLCSHRPSLFPREKPLYFLDHLTDENLRQAHPVNISPYEKIDTRQYDLPDGQMLVFDWARSGL